MQIIENEKQYDVVIVGSGAGGGMATKILADAGLQVAVVEAGPFFDPANPDQQTQLKWPYQSPRRGAGTTRAFGEFDMAYGGWEIDGEPYNQEATLRLVNILFGEYGLIVIEPQHPALKSIFKPILGAIIVSTKLGFKKYQAI